MSIAQIVKNGAVVNVIAVDPSAVVAPGGAKITWPGGYFDAPSGATLMMQAGAAIGWTLSGGVLVAPAAPAPTQATLIAYAQQKQAAIMDGGVTVNVAASGQPELNVECSTTTAYLTLLNGAVQRSGLKSTSILRWEQRDGSVLSLNAAQTQALGLAVANWLQHIFDTRTQSVTPAIVAGTITTYAQIDDPTEVNLPAWPANS
jgi:hypothetical protein